MTQQNLQKWSGGMLSPPSPLIVSILIQSNFPFYQHLSFARVLIFEWRGAGPDFITILCIAAFFYILGQAIVFILMEKNVCSLLYMWEKQKSLSYWGEKRPFS